MSIPDALAAFAEPPTTTVTILEIKTDAILDSNVWGLRHPSGLSIHPSCLFQCLILFQVESDILDGQRINGFSIKGAILRNHQQNIQKPIVEQKNQCLCR
jgi:hypothetical protein